LLIDKIKKDLENMEAHARDPVMRYPTRDDIKAVDFLQQQFRAEKITIADYCIALTWLSDYLYTGEDYGVEDHYDELSIDAKHAFNVLAASSKGVPEDIDRILKWQAYSSHIRAGGDDAIEWMQYPVYAQKQIAMDRMKEADAAFRDINMYLENGWITPGAAADAMHTLFTGPLRLACRAFCDYCEILNEWTDPEDTDHLTGDVAPADYIRAITKKSLLNTMLMDAAQEDVRN